MVNSAFNIHASARIGSCHLFLLRLSKGATMHRLTILYGHPKDPAEFDRYYNEVHIPIAKRMQGLQGWTIGKCESATPGQEPPYYMIVGLYAATRADLEAILASPEGQATIADVPNFASGGFTFMFDDEVVLIPCSLGG
jgi:uncharacterized protein (TIGR02118 family)